MLVVLGVPDPLVPGDDQGVPDRRRRLHGDPRQLRAHGGPGRRRRPAHRLHPDRRRVGRGRHRGADLRLPGLRPLPGRASRSGSCASSPSATCGGEGVRSRLRHPDLLLHRQHGDPARHRLRADGDGHLPHADPNAHGLVSMGHGSADGLWMGATLFVVMHAFASGGAAVTGVEAISNGVPAFRKPEWKNARSTLVVMGIAARRHVPRPVDAGGPPEGGPVRGRHADGDLPDRQADLRRRPSATSCSSRCRPGRC